MSKLPTIIKNILIETYYDFENVDLGDDVSKVNLKNILTDIKNGKDEFNFISYPLNIFIIGSKWNSISSTTLIFRHPYKQY